MSSASSDQNESQPPEQSLAASSETTTPPQDSGDLGGRDIDGYYLIETIGEGGMGVIYKAEQRGAIRRIVALKVIKLGLDTKAVIARFEAERQALALMNHPNIARVFGAGSTPLGRPYFVMEYVPGDPITVYCDKRKLSIRQRLELFGQVCDAAQHAHTKGIIHRDLKASNVLVAEIDGKPVPKIIDFGVAKATNQRLTEHTLFTESGHLIGTPAYMSPEQAEGGVDVDTRSDVYSLGVLLYELLTGSLPFDQETFRKAAYQEIVRIIREDDPPHPSTFYSRPTEASRAAAHHRAATVEELATTLRQELEWIPLRAMRKERTERYPTAADLARDIDNYLGGRPLMAAPDSRFYRFRKGMRRNRGLVLAVASVGLALVLGLVMTTWQAIRAERQKELAQKSALRAQMRLAQSEASGQLLNEVFEAIEPNVVRGKDTQLLREVLGAAQTKVEVILTEPQWRAEHMTVLGNAFRLLGDLERSEQLLSRAIELARMSLQQAIHAGEFEDDFREVRTLIESLDRYGYLKFDREEYSKAVPLFEEALDLAHDHLPADDRDLTDRLANLGTALRLASRLDDAEPKVSAALDRANGDPARHSPDVRAKLTTNLAIVKLGRGDWNGADQAFLAAQALLEQAESASSVEYANLLRNRAVLEHRRNRLAEALELINAAVDLRQALAADVDPLLHSEDLAWRSIILTGLGRLSEAADDLLGSSKLRREQLRDSSLPNLDLQARNTEQAGLLLHEAGRLPEAQQALRECGDLYAQAKAMAVLETAGTSTRPASTSEAGHQSLVEEYEKRRLAAQARWAQVTAELGDTAAATAAIREALIRQQELFANDQSPVALQSIATSQWILAELLLRDAAAEPAIEAETLLLEAATKLSQANAPVQPLLGKRPSVREAVLRRLLALSAQRGDAAAETRWSEQLRDLGIDP